MSEAIASLARFRIVGQNDPELVPRVFGQFARRGIVPAAARVERAADGVCIVIESGDLDARTFAILAEALRTQFLVESVELDFAGTADRAYDRKALRTAEKSLG